MLVDEECIYTPGRPMMDIQSQECLHVSTWATVAVDIYRTQHLDTSSKGPLFITAVSRVFDAIRTRIDMKRPVFEDKVKETAAPTAELLACMADVLRQSLAHSRPNCGACVPLPWIKDVLTLYEVARVSHWAWYRDAGSNPLTATPLTGDETLQPTFLLILRLLGTCLERGLLTGDDTTTCYEKLLEILAHPELPELPSDLTIEPETIEERELTQDGLIGGASGPICDRPEVTSFALRTL